MVLCLSLLGAATAVASEPDWRVWAEAAQKQHPLAGRIYDVAPGKLSTPQDGAVLLPPEGIVLLGEVHDNPAHHRLRAWLIAKALRAQPDWRPAVVFEQIRADQQAALDRFEALRAEGKGTSDDLFRLLEWEKSGWPPASIYEPLFEVVVAARLPILAGNTTRDRIKAVARQGLAALAPEERARLWLDSPQPEPLTEALSKELAESHCGALPRKAIPAMAAAQRYRDAHLADALLGAEKRHGSAILIAGNGHVRSDRGVPWHIRQRKPDAKVISVLLLEVEEGKTEPADYVPRDPDGKPTADLVIFTPRAKRGDPCRDFMKNRK
ncbi:MAG: ChaN family lipoprotein [Hyphomicrobiaceae bacterium]